MKICPWKLNLLQRFFSALRIRFDNGAGTGAIHKALDWILTLREK